MTRSRNTATPPPPPPGKRADVRPDDERRYGLACARCGCRDLRVVYTYPVKDGVRRRRECRNCGWRFTTGERDGV